MNHEQFLNNLVTIAQQDMSLAHVTQHGHGAELCAKLGGFKPSTPGAYSVVKPLDTLELKDNRLTGKKYWISNIPNSEWATLHVRDGNSDKLVFCHIDQFVTAEMIPVMGMENTLTGNLTFDQTPCEIICDTEDPEYFEIRRLTSLGFIANHYGLALGLFNDLKAYTQQQNINCEYDKQKLQLQLNVMELLWIQLDKNITLDHQATFYWQQKNTIYAYAKKCLLDIVQFTTEITNSRLYNLTTEQNQRYRDALIYSTHMKNLYSATK